MAYSRHFDQDVKAAVAYYDEMVERGERVEIVQNGYIGKSGDGMWVVGVDQRWGINHIDRARAASQQQASAEEAGE